MAHGHAQSCDHQRYQEVWSALFRRYRNAPNLPVEMEEIAQHVLIQLWKQGDREVKYLEAWAVKVARNFINDAIHARDRNPEVAIDIEAALNGGSSNEDATSQEVSISHEIRRAILEEGEGECQDEKPSIKDLSALLPLVRNLTRKERLYFLLRYLPVFWNQEKLKEMAFEELADATGQSKEGLVSACATKVSECMSRGEPGAVREGTLSTEAIQSFFPEGSRPTVVSIDTAYSRAMAHMKAGANRDQR